MDFLWVSAHNEKKTSETTQIPSSSDDISINTTSLAPVTQIIFSHISGLTLFYTNFWLGSNSSFIYLRLIYKSIPNCSLLYQTLIDGNSARDWLIDH